MLVPIDIEQMPKIEAIRHKYKNELSQYSFDILYLWKEKMGYRIYVEDDFFVVKYDFGGENAWLFPCGAEDKIYRFIRGKINEKSFRLCSLRDVDIAWLTEHFPDIWEFEHMEDVDEYVCDISDYLSLNGSKYSDIRTQIKKVERKMKVYSKPLTNENLSDALKVITEWENMPHCVGVGNIVDDNESEIAITMYKELNISGIVFVLAVNLFTPQLLSVFGVDSSETALYSSCEVYLRVVSIGAPFIMLNAVFTNFLKNDNNVGAAAIGFFVGNISEIILNIILVIVLDMGVLGAAISMVVCNVLELICYAVSFFRSRNGVIQFRCLRIKLKSVWEGFKIGFPSSVKHVFQFIFILCTNRIMKNIGGIKAVAAFEILYNASFLIQYICDGVADAMQPLVSLFWGQQSDEDCKGALKLATKNGFVLSGIISLIIFVFAKYIAYAFGASDEALSLTITALRTYCIGFAFLALNTVSCKYYQSRENSRRTFLCVFLQKIAVAIPMLFVFSRFGITNVWFAFPAAELVSIALIYLLFIADDKKSSKKDPERIMRVYLANESTDIGRLLDQSMDFCKRFNISAKQEYSVTLVIEEIVASVLRNSMNSVSDGKIRITLIAEENGDFILNILYNSAVFNPFSIVKRKLPQNTVDIDEISMNILKGKTKRYMHRQCYGFNSLFVQI